MRRALAAAAAASVALAVPDGTGAAAERLVAIPGKLFAPERIAVLVGDSVTWTNGDGAAHDVAADDGSFRSGDLGTGDRFSVRFTEAGRHTYLCLIHRYMRGVVEVFGISLAGPRGAVPAGAAVTLQGLADPAAGAAVVEEASPTQPFHAVAAVPVAADGRFSVQLVPVAGAQYRAVAGGLSSAPVVVGVSPRVFVAVARGARVVRLRATTTPSQPHARVELQIYDRERFDWRRIARTRLDSASAATFAVQPRRREHLRVVVVQAIPPYASGPGPVVVVGPPRR